MTPATMAGRGLEVEIIVVAVRFGTLVVHRQVHVTFDHQIFDHRLWFHDLLDTGQFDGLRRLTVGQGHLAVIGGVQ
ncbi:hypothetical protein D3C72_1435650 [compost metagenome]